MCQSNACPGLVARCAATAVLGLRVLRPDQQPGDNTHGVLLSALAYVAVVCKDHALQQAVYRTPRRT